MTRPNSPRRDPFAPRATRARAEPAVPHAFVLDELASVDPRTNPMFGCLAVYVGERIVLILRDKGADDSDNGVWIAFEAAKREAVLARFPRAKPIDIFSGRVSGWLKLSATSRDFEDDVLEACRLVRDRDPLLGKVPKPKRAKAEPKPKATPAPRPAESKRRSSR